jgi:hypothetical protein
MLLLPPMLLLQPLLLLPPLPLLPLKDESSEGCCSIWLGCCCLCLDGLSSAYDGSSRGKKALSLAKRPKLTQPLLLPGTYGCCGCCCCCCCRKRNSLRKCLPLPLLPLLLALAASC